MSSSTSVLGVGLFNDEAFSAQIDAMSAPVEEALSEVLVEALGELAAFVVALITLPVIVAARRNVRISQGFSVGARS